MASRRIGAIVLAAAIVAAIIYVYAPVRHFDFVSFDDPDYVTANSHVTGALTKQNVAWAFTTDHAGNWHPVTWLSHMLDVQVFGMRAGWHHVVNVSFHAASAILLFLLLRRLTSQDGPSAFAAALFALHPLHVESVAWIAERKDVLSTLLAMMTLWCYVNFIQIRSVPRYLAALSCFALGLMAKPMLVTLPFVFWLIDVWPLRRIGQGRRISPTLILEKLPFLALALVSSVITLIVQSKSGAVQSLGAIPLSERLAQSLVSYATYVGRMLKPGQLSVFYPFSHEISAWNTVLAAVFFAMMSLVAIRLRRRRPYVLVGWFWYVVMLIPTIGLVQVGSQALADRYTYMPLIGLFIAIAWSLQDVAYATRASWGRIACGSVALLALGACAFQARAQVRTWASSLTLWQRAVEVTPDSAYAQMGLGRALDEMGRSDEAIAHLRTAVDLDPHLVDARDDLGRLLAQQGRVPEAVEQFAEAVRLRPDDAEIRNNFALVLLDQGAATDAITQFTEALRLKSDFPEAENGLGRALDEVGNRAEALSHFQNAIRLKPDFADAHQNLGRTLAEAGQFSAASEQFLEALRLKPDFAEAHHNLGLVLATEGYADEAIQEFDRAIRLQPALANSALADDEYNVAVRLLKEGRPGDALLHARNAVSSNPHHEAAVRLFKDLLKRRQ